MEQEATWDRLNWDRHNDDFMEGWCWATDTVFWCSDYEWSQHYCAVEGCVYVFDELGEEE